MSTLLNYFRKETKALGRDYNSTKELGMWTMAKFADGFKEEGAVTIVFDTQSSQVIGVIKTDSREKALKALAEHLEPEDFQEAFDWLSENTKLEIFTVLEPK